MEEIKVTKDTSIALGLVLSLLVAMFSLASLYYQSMDNKVRIAKIEDNTTKILERMAGIEQAMKHLDPAFVPVSYSSDVEKPSLSYEDSLFDIIASYETTQSE